MSILTAIITHLDAPRVRRQLDYLRRLAPDSRFAICHGGERAHYDQLALNGSLHIDEPSLRGANRDQSYTEILRGVYEGFVRDEPEIELVHVIEYDHLIVASDFEQRLADLAARSDAGLFAKYASPRNDTNWPHFVRYRRDATINCFFERISCRDDHSIRYGCLGSGMLFRRDALAAIAAVPDPPHAYLEMFVPTLAYHLGFDVVDVDTLGDLYAAVRWRPEYETIEALAEKRRGRAFIHPFKQLDALDLVESSRRNGRAARAASVYV